jgi:FkbM family methyltransferase
MSVHGSPRGRTGLIELARTVRHSVSLARGLSRGRFRVHTFGVLVALRRASRAFAPRESWIELTLPSGASRRFHLNDFTQAAALGEIMLDGEYLGLPDPSTVATILDLGANAGQASVYLRDRFPDARIIAVEPDPKVARITSRNLSGDPLSTVVAGAVCDHDGPVSLALEPARSWGANVVDAWESLNTLHVEVRGFTLGELMREYRLESVDIVKIDIEGAEMMALTTDDALSRVGFVIGELHPELLGLDGQEAVETMRAHGGFARGELRDGRIFVLTR